LNTLKQRFAQPNSIGLSDAKHLTENARFVPAARV
jgi:hypothetical protein